MAEAVAGAELTFVCGPVAELPGLVSAVLEHVAAGATVTDVGSTKGPADGSRGREPRVRRRASRVRVGGSRGDECPRRAVRGRHLVSHARRRRPIPISLRTVHGYVASLGARPVAIDADAHDRLVALTSHLPHALANLLANQAGAGRIDGHDPLAAVGGSFRDMTRVAGANPRIWVDIFLDNRAALLDGLREHARGIDTLVRALEREDAGYVARWIAEASGNRRRMLAEAYRTTPEELHRVRMRVPDRPGAISAITQALGAEGINIEDFELHHLSTDVGGSVVVVIAGADQADRAVELLDSQGYQATTTAVVEQ